MKIYTPQEIAVQDTYLSLLSSEVRRYAYATIAEQGYRLNVKQLIDKISQHFRLAEMTVRYHLKLMREANMFIVSGKGHSVHYAINPATARRALGVLGEAQELIAVAFARAVAP